MWSETSELGKQLMNLEERIDHLERAALDVATQVAIIKSQVATLEAQLGDVIAKNPPPTQR